MILEDHEPDSLALYAVYPSSRHATPKLRAFVDYVAERFDGASF